MMTVFGGFTTWTLTLWVFVPLLVLNPLEARAQVVASSFEELRSLVKQGDTIEVTDASGRKHRGRLGDFSPSALELLVRKTAPDGRDAFVPYKRLSEGDVTEIRLEHRDSVLNGTLMGAAVGAGPFLLAGMASAVSHGGSCGSDFNVCPAVALFTGPIGAGIGAWVDASKRKRTTVYSHAASRQSSAVRLSPVASKSVRGLQVSVLF